MKFETVASFDADSRRLKPEQRAVFRRVVRDKFAPACATFAADPATAWPKSLRVKAVRASAGIFEMTWSFAQPDARATFELITVYGELRCRWRRIGNHSVFKRP